MTQGSDLPLGWRRVRLSDVCMPTPRRNPASDGAGSFLYVDIDAIDNRRQEIVAPKVVDNAQAPSRARHEIRAGDVIFSLVRPYLKNIAVVPAELDMQIASTAFCILRPTEALVTDYLFHAVSTDGFIASVPTYGHSPPAGRDDELLDLSIALPPIEVQHRLVSFLEEQLTRLASATDSVQRARQRLRSLQDSTLARLFTESETLASTAQPADEVGMRTLGGLLSEPLRNGHSAKTAVGGPVRTLTLTAVTTGDFSERNTKLIDAEPRRVASLWLKPGDLLIERSNTAELVGTASLYRGAEKFTIFPDLIIRARVGPFVSPEYVEMIVKAPQSRRYLQSQAKGIAGNMPKIDQPTVADLPVPVPPIAAQEKLVEAWEAVRQKAALLAEDIDRAVTRAAVLKQEALRSALRGRLAF